MIIMIAKELVGKIHSCPQPADGVSSGKQQQYVLTFRSFRAACTLAWISSLASIRFEKSICRCAAGVVGSNRRSKSACQEEEVVPAPRAEVVVLRFLDDLLLAAASSSSDASKLAKSSVSAAGAGEECRGAVGRKDLNDGNAEKAEADAVRLAAAVRARNFMVKQIIREVLAAVQWLSKEGKKKDIHKREWKNLRQKRKVEDTVVCAGDRSGEGKGSKARKKRKRRKEVEVLPPRDPLQGPGASTQIFVESYNTSGFPWTLL